MKHTLALLILFASITAHAHNKSCDLGDNNFKLSCVPESIIETKQCDAWMKRHFNSDATFLDEYGHEKSIEELCDWE